MRVLVTGAAGQLGVDLVEACRRAGDEVIGADRAAFDVGDRTQVKQVVAAVSPDVVVNAAAWTDVDACEADPDGAMHHNGYGVRWLREACDTAGAHLVQISTDYVFDGRLKRPYLETDDPNPLSAYGKSKLFGEQAAGPEATIVRTSWVCGAAGRNMVKTVLRLLASHDTLTFVDDQVGCPTFTADLAPLVRQLAAERRTGLFHATNQGAVSWYGFVRDIVAATGRNPDMVHPIATAELQPPRPAPRPANSVLENAALRSAGIPLLRHYGEPLAELVAHLTR